MQALIIVLSALLLLALLYVLAVRGRSGHPGLQALRGWNYAHRGLHDTLLPENSMGAFRAALEAGYGIELDIHLMRDGTLAVIHDSSLRRTAGAEVDIEDLTAEELENYHLGGTAETIPTFRQVLQLFDGKAPLIVELKAAGNNHAALSQAACDLLDQYNGPYCIESFDPRCIHWLRKNRPDVIRGQLSENFVKTKSPLPFVLKFGITHHLENFLLVPDFIAYKFEDRRGISLRQCEYVWKPVKVTWTIRNKADLVTAEKEDRIVIFEQFDPET